MVCLLLFQMSYSLIGEARHKWHGIALLVLFVFHNLMNRGFYKSLFRGKYGPFRVLQMILAFLAVLSMAGAMISGLSMAGDIVPFVPLKLRGSTARDIGLYMTLQNQFVFFDFEEPLVFFILDYLAVMGPFVWAGYYMAEWVKRFSARKIRETNS